MRYKNFILLSMLSIAIFGLIGCSNDSAEEVFDPEPNPDAAQISSYNDDCMEKQKEMDEDILSEYKQEEYTFNKPFIQVDPYDASPLSALVMFKTNDPVQVEVIVGGEKGEETISHKWDEQETSHIIPVLGLYPGTNNKVILKITNKAGDTKETEVTIATDDLPDDFLETTLVDAHQKGMEDGLTYIVPTSGTLYGVDANADVRWYSTLKNRLVFTRLENDHFLQMTREGDKGQYDELLEVDMLGKVYNAYTIDIEGTDEKDEALIHHDVIEMPNGNLLATTHEPDSDYVEDHMHEIDRETGETTQEINLREIMPDEAYKEYDGKNADINDWIHQNAIWFDDEDKSILISGRSQDIILNVSYPDGEIQWILGADEDWPEEYEDYLLEPIGDVKFPAGQHAMKIVDNPELEDEPKIKDIILFDNNEVITRGDEDESGEYSQAIRYQIDEDDMTVEQTWSYGKERGKSFFSHIIGNVQYLYDKNNIILNSGATSDDDSPTGRTGRIVEVDATKDNSKPIFELEVQGKNEDAVRYIYRTWRYPLYPEED